MIRMALVRGSLSLLAVGALAGGGWATGCIEVERAAGPVSPLDAQGDGSVASDAAGQDVAAPDPTGDPMSGGAKGRVVRLDTGQPVVGIKVLACSAEACLQAKTLDDGTYTVGKLAAGPHKMQALGSLPDPVTGLMTPKYVTLVWNQEIELGFYDTAPRDILVPLLPETPEGTWDPAVGGSITLADGALRLTAEAGTFDFPVGTFIYDMWAVSVQAADLPPFDIEPWVGHEAGTLAFYVNPYHVEATEPVQAELLGTGAAVGAVYDLYYPDGVVGLLQHAGTATVNAAGIVASDPDSTLLEISTLVAVPR